MTRINLMPGIALNHVQTSQFKTNSMTAYLLRPLNESEAALNALVPLVLRRGNVKHRDLSAMSAALDNLYGATLSAIVLKRGEWHTSGLASAFIGGVLKETLELFCDTLFKPVLGGYIAQERDNLINRIRALKNDKAQYAIQRLDALACCGEPYAVSRFGDEKSAHLITDSLFEAHYRKMLSTSRMEFFYCGSSAPQDIQALLMPYLEAVQRDYTPFSSFKQFPAPPQLRNFTEFEDVTQAKLSIMWRINPFGTLRDFLAAYAAVMIYGGPSGRLFEHVRERLSLCYYADAQLDRYKGVMKAQSGVEFSNIGLARGEMLAQWECVTSGGFSEDELKHAKAVMLNTWVSAGDSPTGLEAFWQGQAAAGLSDSLVDWIRALKDIEKSDVVKAASGFAPDSVYCMRAEE